MSDRERVIQIVNTMPEYRITGLLAFLQSYEDIPNETTIAAMQEVDEMIQKGSGQHFKGSAEEFFAMLDAEDGDDDDA